MARAHPAFSPWGLLLRKEQQSARLWGQWSWVGIASLPRTSFVTLGEWLNLPEPPFRHSKVMMTVSESREHVCGVLKGLLIHSSILTEPVWSLVTF